jgi:hypothetical protein
MLDQQRQPLQTILVDKDQRHTHQGSQIETDLASDADAEKFHMRFVG